jgi:uncharacterized repeat protein (TIGR03803 family)
MSRTAQRLNSIVRDGTGNIYGTTAYGGACGWGIAFKLDTKGRFKVLHCFAGDPKDGAGPGRLMQDALGELYGTAAAGGGGKNSILSKLVGTAFGNRSFCFDLFVAMRRTPTLLSLGTRLEAFRPASPVLGLQSVQVKIRRRPPFRGTAGRQ